MSTKPSSKDETKLVGTVPVGITKQVAEQAGRRIARQLMAVGQPVKVESLRFLPSSKMALDSGFQVIANTTVALGNTHEDPPRMRILDSVVTVDRANGRQVLRGIKIPALER